MSKIFRIEKLKKEIYLKTSILQFFNSSILLYYFIAEFLAESEAHFLKLELLDLAGAGQDIVHLIGGDSIETAAEGVQLDQLEIVPRTHIGGGRVET